MRGSRGGARGPWPPPSPQNIAPPNSEARAKRALAPPPPGGQEGLGPPPPYKILDPPMGWGCQNVFCRNVGQLLLGPFHPFFQSNKIYSNTDRFPTPPHPTRTYDLGPLLFFLCGSNTLPCTLIITNIGRMRCLQTVYLQMLQTVYLQMLSTSQ